MAANHRHPHESEFGEPWRRQKERKQYIVQELGEWLDDMGSDTAQQIDNDMRNNPLLSHHLKIYDHLSRANRIPEPPIYSGIGAEVEFEEMNGQKGFRIKSLKEGSPLDSKFVGSLATHYEVLDEKGQPTWQKITKETDYVAIREAALNRGVLKFKMLDPQGQEIETTDLQCAIFQGEAVKGKFSFAEAKQARIQKLAAEAGRGMSGSNVSTNQGTAIDERGRWQETVSRADNNPHAGRT